MSRQISYSLRRSTSAVLAVSLFSVLFVGIASADVVFYTGNPMLDPEFAGFNCPAPCSVTGTVTFSSPLAANQPLTTVSPVSWDFTVNNGLYDFNNVDGTGIFAFQTNSIGIDFWNIQLRLNVPLIANGASGLQFLNSVNLPPSGGGGDILGSQPSNAFLEGNHNSPGSWQAATAVPEPSSLALFVTGLATVAGAFSRHRRSA